MSTGEVHNQPHVWRESAGPRRQISHGLIIHLGQWLNDKTHPVSHQAGIDQAFTHWVGISGLDASHGWIQSLNREAANGIHPLRVVDVRIAVSLPLAEYDVIPAPLRVTDGVQGMPLPHHGLHPG